MSAPTTHDDSFRHKFVTTIIGKEPSFAPLAGTLENVKTLRKHNESPYAIDLHSDYLSQLVHRLVISIIADHLR